MACWRATNKTIFALVSPWFSKATLANFTFRQTHLATVRLFCSSTTKEPSLEKVSSKTFREEATKRKPLPEFIIKDWNELTLKQKMQRIFFRRYARSQAAFNLYDLCEAQSSRPEFSKSISLVMVLLSLTLPPQFLAFKVTSMAGLVYVYSMCGW